ncbi:ankyrin repeat-containing protein, partial [Pyrenophora tritici-repentis]
STAFVKMLLENGADFNATDDCGRTPLRAASTEGYEDIVKILSKKEAEDKKAKAGSGNKRDRSS